MPRHKAIVPNRQLHTTLPEPIMAEVDRLLYSEGLGRVPFGAMQAFLVSLITKALESRSLDLSPFVPCLPGQYCVEGDPASIMTLTTLLKEAQNG